MQTNDTQKLALINSRQHTRKPILSERTDRAWFSRLLQHPAMETETERVYSYNTGARTGWFATRVPYRDHHAVTLISELQ